jgi:hypothetical protein
LLVKLLGYSYKIEYKKGKENKTADALSRRPHSINAMALTTAIPLWVNEVLDSYIEDAKCKELEQQLRIIVVPSFSIANGLKEKYWLVAQLVSDTDFLNLSTTQYWEGTQEKE